MWNKPELSTESLIQKCGTNLDGTKYKIVPENAENQNNIQLDTLKITNICF